MKFIDMFCGMGTIRMGFEQAGHECVCAIEFDKHKRNIYKIIFGEEPEFGDITTVRGTDLPYADCWCFGAPCQDFSLAGKRAGLDGNGSGLVREVFRLIEEKEPSNRPEWLLYENVKGMLSSNLGWDFATIQTKMGELGYDVQWQLLNSKDFEVPQNRERVYTIGHLRARGERKIFPLSREISCTDVYESTVKQIGNVMPTKTRDNPNQGRVYDPIGLAPCLNKAEGGGRLPLITEPCACLTPDRLEKRQNGRRFKGPGEPMFTLTKQDIHGILFTQKKITRETEIAGTLTARSPSASRGNCTPITGVLSYDLKATPKSTRRGTVKAEYVGALDTQCNIGVTANTRIRRLTPRECMRLQGVPDYITDKLIAAGISDTQMYRAAGDACTVNVIYEIARRMI